MHRIYQDVYFGPPSDPRFGGIIPAANILCTRTRVQKCVSATINRPPSLLPPWAISVDRRTTTSSGQRRPKWLRCGWSATSTPHNESQASPYLRRYLGHLGETAVIKTPTWIR